MTTLIFADTHLTDRFEENKYDFLRQIIEPVDQVIINGDFWDSWHCTFDQFINSEWSSLFHLLKKKQTIYLYGNHDKADQSDRRRFEFCAIARDDWSGVLMNEQVEVNHGYQLLINKRGRLESLYRELVTNYGQQRPIVMINRRVLRLLEEIGYKMWPRLMTHSHFAQKSNQLMKQAKVANSWFIGADTHYAEIDRQQKYANCGSILHGYGSYLLVEGKKIELINQTY